MTTFRVAAAAAAGLALLAGCEGVQKNVNDVGNQLGAYGSQVGAYSNQIADKIPFGDGRGVGKASRVEPRGSAFSKSLYSGYLGLAKAEFAEGDYGDSDRFADYAIKVAAGADQQPEDLSSRKLPQSATGELGSARARLMKALAAGARTKAPADAANAQVMFDCWMQEQEENFQPKDIEKCKAGFMTAMAKVDGATAVAAPSAKKYVIYFPFNSSTLTEASARMVEQAIDDAKAMGGAKITLTGHTDRSGVSGYNKRLSGKRVLAVANALKKGGISETSLDWNSYGEASPAVKTQDGVRNRLNRRVEVVITK